MSVLTTQTQLRLQQLLQDALQRFGTDRAWLLYPCDPEEESWQVLLEATRDEYPGALALNTDLPMTPESAAVFRTALAYPGAIPYDQTGKYPLPAEACRQFSFRSQLTLAIHPPEGKPWLFGMHQCSHDRIWSEADCWQFEYFAGQLPSDFSEFLALLRLEESEKRFKGLVANLPGAVYRCGNDPALTIHYMSAAIEKITGYPAREFLGRQVHALEGITHPDDREQIFRQVREALAAKSSYELEYRLLNRDGQIVWVQDCGQGVFNQQGHLQHLDGVMFDITARKSSEMEIQKLRQLLIHADKMHSVGTLAVGIAHEINNPLAGILQNLQLVSRRLGMGQDEGNRQAIEAAGLDPEKLADFLAQRQVGRFLDAATDAGLRAAQIVKNLLGFGRRGGSELAPQPIPPLIEQAIDLAAGFFSLKKGNDFKRIHIERDYPPELPEIPCDGAQLQQVFLNLLHNGAQAMLEKREQLLAAGDDSYLPCFRIAIAVEQQRLWVCFEDNGPGIPETRRAQVFDPFFSSKKPGEGTGLGLTISYFIIQQHSGTIAVEGSPSGGARFVVTLPLPA